VSRLWDLLILLAISAFVISGHPTLGILFLLINLIFATQFWKTLLLIGSGTETSGVGRRVKAGILAVVFTAILYFATSEPQSVSLGLSAIESWNGDFFPIVAALFFLTSLLLVGLITEKRKR